MGGCTETSKRDWTSILELGGALVGWEEGWEGKVYMVR
jgi:hypothetical protein